MKTFSELKKELESENNTNFHEEEEIEIINENTFKESLRIRTN